MICYFPSIFFPSCWRHAGVAIVSCKSDGRGTSTDDMLLATIDVCKSLDTARSSNPSPPPIIGSARCMSYNMSDDMSYPEHLALHNMQGGSQILSPHLMKIENRMCLECMRKQLKAFTRCCINLSVAEGFGIWL